ncbi:MAG: copper resistance CopC family protein [Dehalococcoidia bacterium]
MVRMTRFLLLPALVSVLSLLHAAVALAHAHYDHSTPGIGQVMPAAPSRVDIYTDSEMRKIAGANLITVSGVDGNQVDDGNTTVDDADRQHFFVALKPNLPAGRYVVAFQTLSDADGDTDHGRYAFYVGSGPTTEQKALDANLGTAASVAAPQTSGSSPPILLLEAGGGALIIALVDIGALLLRRRQRAHE